MADHEDMLPEEPLPVNLELAVGELRKIVDEIERLEAKKTELETAKETYRTMIRDQMLVQGVTKFSTPHGSITGKTKTYHAIADFSALEHWVIENNHLELFQRRLNNAAVMELSEQGQEIPGITKYEKFEIQFRRK